MTSSKRDQHILVCGAIPHLSTENPTSWKILQSQQSGTVAQPISSRSKGVLEFGVVGIRL